MNQPPFRNSTLTQASRLAICFITDVGKSVLRLLAAFLGLIVQSLREVLPVL